MLSRLVGFAGSFNRPSKTYTLVNAVLVRASETYSVPATIIDLQDVGPSLGRSQWRRELDEQALQVIEQIVSADALVIGSPTFKGSYSGLFKHLIDLIEPHELRSKPIIIVGTGGGDRHALMVEHQLRPLFGFFMSHVMPTAIYASDRDFTDYIVSSDALSQRIDAAVHELRPFIPVAAPSLQAAE